MADLLRPRRKLTPEEQIKAFNAELAAFKPGEGDVAVKFYNPPAPPPPAEEDAAAENPRPYVSIWEGVDTAHHALAVADQAHARIEAMASGGGDGQALTLLGVFARLLREDEVTVEIDGERRTFTLDDLKALAPDAPAESEDEA